MSSVPLIFHCHKQIAIKLKKLSDKVNYFLSVLLPYVFIVIMGHLQKSVDKS